MRGFLGGLWARVDHELRFTFCMIFDHNPLSPASMVTKCKRCGNQVARQPGRRWW